MRIESKIGAGFVVGLAMVVTLGIVSFQTIQHQVETGRWVIHTHQVLESLESVLSAFRDAETGQRGFLLTGQEPYLEPYHAATGVIGRNLDTLGELTKDNPTQQQSLRQLRTLAEAKLAELRETIRLRQQHGLQAALPESITDRDKRMMDDIRSAIGQMESRERRLLDLRTEEANASARCATWAMVIWMPVSLLVLAIAALAIIRTARWGVLGEPSGSPGRKWAGLATQYAAAVIVVAVAAVLRWRLIEAFGPLPTFITFYPAVILVATIGGGGPGIVATVLSALAADYWFIPPYGEFGIEAPNDALALAIFTATSLFLSVLAERLRRARWAEAFTAALEQRAKELARQNEELNRQSEELSQQAEELAQQAEELSQQNEDLQTQSAEIQALNIEVGHRETLLQTLLDAAHLAGSERAAMQDICAAAMGLFGEAAAAGVYEKQAGQLIVRAIAGLSENAALAERPAEHSFAELVIQQNRTACLNDTSLRPDLSILEIPGQVPFQAVLCAPMQIAGQPFGTVAVYSQQPHAWTAQEFRLAEWLAGQCTRILETLRTQENLRRQVALIDLSPDGIMVRHMDGTIILWGHGAEVLYGWTKEEAIGRTTHALLKTQLPEPLEQIHRRLEEAGRWSGELIHTTKDGRLVVVESRWMAERDAQGRIAEILESNVDITERKRAEEELRRTVAELERSNHELEQFAYITSHDLQEPLRQVRSFVQLLQERHQEKLDGNALEYMHFVYDGAARMSDLIHDLLAYSRVGVREETRCSTSCTAALDAALANLQASVTEAQAAITHDDLPTVLADPRQLSQLFQNLVGNAIKFRRDDVAPQIRVGARLEGANWLIWVQDNGIGIDPQYHERIFLVFQRLHSREKYAGTGIGLAICKKIVEQHGGRLWLKSEAGKGATFYFTLPAAIG